MSQATSRGVLKGECTLELVDGALGADRSQVLTCGVEGTPNRLFRSLRIGRFDRGMALGIALVGHLALLGFFWGGAGARAGSITAEAGDGSMITVDFVAVSPPMATPSLAALAQRLDVANNENTDAAAAESAAPTESLPLSEGDQPAADANGLVSKDEQGRGADTGAPAGSRSDASAHMMPTSGPKGEEGTAANDGLEGRYLAAIKRSVAAHWSAPAGRNPSGTCTLTLYQTPGGQVQSAISDRCALNEADRRRLEAAALMAQPLPYLGFETVFREEVVLEFDLN